MSHDVNIQFKMAVSCILDMLHFSFQNVEICETRKKVTSVYRLSLSIPIFAFLHVTFIFHDKTNTNKNPNSTYSSYRIMPLQNFWYENHVRSITLIPWRIFSCNFVQIQDAVVLQSNTKSPTGVHRPLISEGIMAWPQGEPGWCH